MRCASCGAESPTGRPGCGACGGVQGPSAWIVCRHCGARYPESEEFCSRCNTYLTWEGERVEAPGTERTDGPTCAGCGTRNDPARRFCRRCGEDLAPPEPAPTPLAVVPVVRLAAPRPRRVAMAPLGVAAAVLLVVAAAGGVLLASGGAAPAPSGLASALPSTEASGSDAADTAAPTDSSTPTPTARPTTAPAASAWTELGSLPSGRWGAGAVVLADGSILVAGGSESGRSTGAVAAAHLLTVSGDAVGVEALPDLREPRVYPMTVLLDDGSVLVAGGMRAGEPLRSAERYDPTLHDWLDAGRMHEPRAHATAILLRDGRVLVAGGGVNASGRATRTAELFDPATGAWTRIDPMAEARALHEIALTSDGRVLVAGGADNFVDGEATRSTEVFDPATGGWTRGPGMTVPRYAFASTILDDGRLLALGGWSSRGGTAESLDSAEVLEGVGDAWRPGGRLREGRAQASVVTLLDGRVLAAGGVGPTAGGERLAGAELYDPGSGAWKPADSLPCGVAWPKLLLLDDGRVLAVGGLGPQRQPIATIVAFTPPAR